MPIRDPARIMPTRRLLLAAGAATLAAPGIPRAQGRYPDRPIQLVVPWPAGGSADVQLRSIGDIVAKALGQPMVIQNRPLCSPIRVPHSSVQWLVQPTRL